MHGQAELQTYHGRLEILVWNIFKNKKQDILQDLGKMMQGVDLALFQESVLDDCFNEFLRQSRNYEWVMARSFSYGKERNATGIITAARVSSQEVRFYRSPDQEPLVGTHKMGLATVYPLKKYAQTLLVLNVHALNFVSTEKYLKQISQIISEVKDHNGPVILGGDFNTWNKMRLRYLKNIARELQMTSVNFQLPKNLKHFNKVLDHVFYRGLSFLSAQAYSQIKSSDHKPLKVLFEII